MKRTLIMFSCIALICSCNSKDDSKLNKDMKFLQDKVAELEQMCNHMSNTVTILQHEVNNLQDGIMISKITGTRDGYKIGFSDGTNISVVSSSKGRVPVIAVEKFTDGNYYWTIDGQIMTDKNGGKVKAQVVEDKSAKAKAQAAEEKGAKIQASTSSSPKSKTTATATTTSKSTVVKKSTASKTTSSKPATTTAKKPAKKCIFVSKKR